MIVKFKDMEETIETVEQAIQNESQVTTSVQDAISNAANQTFVQQTSDFVNWLKSFNLWEILFKVLGTLLVIFIFWGIYKIINRGIKKIPEQKLTKQRSSMIMRFLKYLFYVFIVLYVLGLFGINLKAIWGAAGIAGVAIGFAAQTSVSNIISGLFVLTEGSIHVGDAIVVDDITGIVDEVNLLSIRIHTYDNQMVRIPNSNIINNNLINNSIHSKRRITVTLDVEYKTDLNKALQTFLDAAKSCPTVIEKPAPTAWVDSFGDNGVNITVAVWFKSSDYIQTKNDLHIAILEQMKKNKIQTPFNIITLDK